VSGADRVDLLIANSGFIAQRIRECYRRDARVIHPFADLSRFTLPRRPGPKYLMVGAFAPYKRTELAIEACNRLRLPLVIAGSGQDEPRLRRIAGPTVEFVGAVSNAAIADLYAQCRAFLFPGVEDFGITPLEAMAAGAPVVAYGEGGAAETVTERTGILFRPQTVQALMDALRRFESGQAAFREEDCRERAAEFTRTAFQRQFAEAVRQAWAGAGKDPALLELKA
jgi:glycosyltransferase involved in cell wall biosynthesis